MKLFGMACIAFAAIITVIVLSVWLGPDRAQRRIEYWMQRWIEWRSGEGKHRNVPNRERKSWAQQ